MKSVEVVAAIIIKNGDIFAAQRGSGKHKDKWEFPGGKVEPGEKIEAALSRELCEELNIQVEPKKLLTTVNYSYPDFHLIMHCFLCRVVAGEINLLEHEDGKWLKERELDSLDWLPPDIEAVNKLKEFLKTQENSCSFY